MEIGKIKVFFKDRGFGFIIRPGFLDCYFHSSTVDGEINIGDLVFFEPVPSNKKREQFQAKTVRRLFITKDSNIDTISNKLIILPFLTITEQKNLFSIEINKIGIIDSPIQFEKAANLLLSIKSYYHSNFIFPEFIKLMLFEACSIEFQIEFFFINIFPYEWKVPLDYIINSFHHFGGEKLRKILTYLDEKQKYEIWHHYLDKIGKIDSINNYARVKNLLSKVLEKNIEENTEFNLSTYIPERVVEELFLISDYNFQFKFFTLGIYPKDFLHYLGNKFESFDTDLQKSIIDVITHDESFELICNVIINNINEKHNITKLINDVKFFFDDLYLDDPSEYAELTEINNPSIIKRFLKFPVNISHPFWLICIRNLWEESEIFLTGEKLKYNVVYSLLDQHLDLLLPINQDKKYLFVTELLDSFNRIVEVGLKNFSPQTIKRRKKMISLNVHNPIMDKILEFSSHKYKLFLTIDGYYNLIDQEWVWANIESFDESIIAQILSLRNYSLNKKIINKKIQELKNIEGHENYNQIMRIIDLAVKYDPDGLESYLEEIKLKVSIDVKIQLWLNRYIKSLNLIDIFSYFSN
ncbi:MAG: cold shock domain-containing protein, partial [Bacteroidales bacterium]|nr:cold shock domain-containing protein [Bacteroidales bacterium]